MVGPGSVGAFFAAHLAATGRDIVACARRPFDEYVIESPSMPARAPARVVTEPSDVDDTADWVLVAVKSHQTDGRGAVARPPVRAEHDGRRAAERHRG